MRQYVLFNLYLKHLKRLPHKIHLISKPRERDYTLAWVLSLAYLILIIILTWWSNRSPPRPVASLSQSATQALDETIPFPLSRSGPMELKALGAVLYRLINQLEAEVSKTIDLEQENKERRSRRSTTQNIK